MNKLSSLVQVRMYKPVVLQANTHKLLSKKLKFFTCDVEYTHLRYTYWFETARYQSVLQKMGRIGWFADQICHHPQWKLMANNLDVVISTHDIGNKISLKDYILADFIEMALEGKDIEKQLFDKWNRHNVSVSQLLSKVQTDQAQL